jgi:hypothetical protein
MSHTITIAGKSFSIEPRYAEGHTLTANEASALNQTYFENLRNNFATKAKEGADQASFNEYVAAYQFGVRSAGGSRDPIEAEAMDLARESVRDAIKRSGKKISDYTAAAISAAAEKLLAKPDKGAELRELARQRVEQMRSAASNEVDSDLLGDLETAQAEAASKAPAEGSTDSAPATSGRKSKAAA